MLLDAVVLLDQGSDMVGGSQVVGPTVLLGPFEQDRFQLALLVRRAARA